MCADATKGIFRESHNKTAKKYIIIGMALHSKAFKKWGYTSVNQITTKQTKTALYRVYREEILSDFIRIARGVEYYSPTEVKRIAQAKILKLWLASNEIV
jgi:hypothetical protein